MDYETRSIQGTIQASSGRTISGYAVVYNTPSHEFPGGFREVVKPGAFGDLVRGDIRALVGHDTKRVIGRTKSGTLTLRDTSYGLHFSVDVPDTQIGK